jgi:hypothetical protein
MAAAPLRVVEEAAVAKDERTCCNCCHIKYGTALLGLVELVGVALVSTALFTHLAHRMHDSAKPCILG